MALETLRPDGELSDLGLVTNSELDHDHDPDSDTTTVDPTANNVNTEWGGDFPIPTGNPTTGANKQEFRVGVIKFETGQAGTPNARIELWENGSLVRAGSNTGISGTHSVLSFLWDASELATPNGSLVQCKLIGTKVGGAGGTRAAVGIGGMEWNVEYTAGGSTTQKAIPITATGVVADTRLTTRYRAKAVTATGVVVDSRVTTRYRAKATTAAAVAVVSRVTTRNRSQAMTATGVAALSTAFTAATSGYGMALGSHANMCILAY